VKALRKEKQARCKYSSVHKGHEKTKMYFNIWPVTAE